MGSSKKVTVGYWYLPAWHAGLGIGPIDAFLEFRGGDKTAWSGELTSSGSIYVYAPNLWGGEKDQGGIVGEVDVMFGEATQQPNQYLIDTFGDQQSAWRGMATLVFKGGKYGAMNPYPQKASYKIRRIIQAMRADGQSEGWYEEKAAVPTSAMVVRTYEDFVSQFESNDPSAFQLIGSDIANTTVNTANNNSYWGTELGNYLPTRLYCEFIVHQPGQGDPLAVVLQVANPSLTNHTTSMMPRTELVSDPLGRPSINYFSTFLPIYSAALDLGVWYSYATDLDYDAGSQSYELRREGEVIATGTAPFNTQAPRRLAFQRSHNLAGTIAVCAYRKVILTGIMGNAEMNPAHILYYSITQSDMGRESTDSINDASFTAAADWFYAQRFGLCTAYDPSAESVDEFQQRICRVAGCGLTRSLIDGQWHLDIANGVYDIGSLPVLTDDDILEFNEQPTLLDSAVNSVSVRYFDHITKEAIVTPPVQALALISDFGTNHLTIDYLEIANRDLAVRVAQRELIARITPLRGFQLKTTRKPYSWRPSTYFRLQAPRRGISDMVCILSEKSSGQLRSGAMAITATQDVYSVPQTAYVAVEEGVDTRPSQVPRLITLQRVIEVPYIDLVAQMSRADLAALPEDVGYAVAVASDPETSRDYAMCTAPSGGDYVEVATGEFTPTATVNESAACDDTEFTLSEGKLLSQVEVGTAALWDDEICRVDAIDVDAGTITLGRGCADTVPQLHEAESRLWFYQEANAIDPTEYTDGETIDVKLLTNTGSQQLLESSATAMSLTFDQRHSRPYPPGQLRVNGAAYPESVTDDVTVSWVHRDRLQQDNLLVDSEDAGVGPEAGTTYLLRIYSNVALKRTIEVDGTSYTYPISTEVMDGGPFDPLRFTLHAVRDGLESLQGHDWSVAREFTVDPESATLFLQSFAGGSWYGRYGSISESADGLVSDDGESFERIDAGEYGFKNLTLGPADHYFASRGGQLGRSDSTDLYGDWTWVTVNDFPVRDESRGVTWSALRYLDGTMYAWSGSIIVRWTGSVWEEVGIPDVDDEFVILDIVWDDANSIFLIFGNLPEEISPGVFEYRSQVYSSTDLNSWELGDPLMPNPTTDNMSISAVARADSTIIVTMRDHNSTTEAGHLALSTDMGATWSFPDITWPITTPALGPISACHDGTQFLIGGKDWVGRSTDGDSWTFVTEIFGASENFGALLTDGAGKTMAALSTATTFSTAYTADGTTWDRAYLAEDVVVTWDTATQNGNLALSNGDLTAQKSAAGSSWRSIRATLGVSTGKYYWEIKLDSGTPNNEIFGVARDTLSQTSFVGSSANTYGFQSATAGPLKWNNNSSTAYGTAVANGDVLCIALDMDNGKVWFGKNGTWMASGDPATGSNPSFSGLSGVMYPAAAYFLSGTVSTARFAAGDWSYSPPAGFSALGTS